MQPTTPRTDFIPVVLGGDIGAYALCRQFHEAFGILPIIMSSGFVGMIQHSRIVDRRLVASLSAHDLLEAITAIALEDRERRGPADRGARDDSREAPVKRRMPHPAPRRIRRRMR